LRRIAVAVRGDQRLEALRDAYAAKVKSGILAVIAGAVCHMDRGADYVSERENH